MVENFGAEPSAAARDDLWYLRLPHERIVDLIWVLEGYDGLAVIRVLDKERGIVELLVAPDLATELEQVLLDLTRSFPLERIARPEGIESISDNGSLAAPRLDHS